MNSLTDQQLLREYAERRSETAFTEIVRRHVDLVHSAALRMVRDSHQAKDVTQGTFLALAQNAGRLASHPVLSGWLHTTARHLGAKTIRAAMRRQSHEQEVVAMNQLLAAEPDPSWEHIAPHLDAALGELNDADRDAVLLRYFEKKSATDIGSALGISAEAAQKRVNRAVERLRELLAKRGVTVSAGGLVVVLASAVQAAPVGLVVTISAAALAGTATTTSTLIAATTKTVAMTALQKTLVTATIAALAGAGIYEARQAARLRDRVQTLQQEHAPLAEQLQQLQKDNKDLAARLVNAADELAKQKGNTSELLKLRSEVARLRTEADASAKDLREARDWQTEMMQVFSNTPPVRTFVSSTSIWASWDQAIVTGGWKTPSGKRAIVLVQLQPGDDSRQLTISSKVLEYTETAGEQIGLSQFNTDDQSPGGNPQASTHKLTSGQVELLLKSATTSQGIEISAAPSVTTLSGQQAQIQAVDVRSIPSGEKYTTGPVIDFFPTISPDGQSVQLVMTAQLTYPIQLPWVR